MRWKLLTRGENSSRRLVLLRTAAFYSLGLCDTQTRINLTKGKFKTFVDFEHVHQISCYLLCIIVLYKHRTCMQSLSRKLTVKVWKKCYIAHNMKWKKELIGASKVNGGLSNISWKICHCLFLINKTLICAMPVSEGPLHRQQSQG